MIGSASVVISSVMNRFLMVHGLDTIAKFAVRSCVVIAPPEFLADFISSHFPSFRFRHLYVWRKDPTTFHATLV